MKHVIMGSLYVVVLALALAGCGGGGGGSSECSFSAALLQNGTTPAAATSSWRCTASDFDQVTRFGADGTGIDIYSSGLTTNTTYTTDGCFTVTTTLAGTTATSIWTMNSYNASTNTVVFTQDDPAVTVTCRKADWPHIMEQEMAAYEAITQTPEVSPCNGTVNTSCNCPGGGTWATDNTGNMTVTDCKDAAGETFTGTLTFGGTQENPILIINFPVFGNSCTNVQVPDYSANGCGGTQTGTCDGAEAVGTFEGTAADCNLVVGVQYY